MAIPAILPAAAKALPYLLSAATFLPFLGGRGGAGQNTIGRLQRGQLANLANQLGIDPASLGAKDKRFGKVSTVKLQDAVMEELVKQQMPGTTRLGTLQGTGTGSAFGRSGVVGALGIGAFDSLSDTTGDPSFSPTDPLSVGMGNQLGLMEEDLARLNMASGVSDTFNRRMAGVESELSSLLSPADLYSISTAAAADQMSQQGMGMAMQGMAGVPQV